MLSIFRRKRPTKIDVSHSGADNYAGPSSRVVPQVNPPLLPSYNEHNRSGQPPASSYNGFNRSTESLPPPYEESPRSIQPLESSNPSSIPPQKPKRSLGSLLRKYNYRKGGYNGLQARRARTMEIAEGASSPPEIYTPEALELPAIEDHQQGGICLQCGRDRMSEALVDRNIVDGEVVGICRDCYPSFLQFLELQAADDSSLELLPYMIDSVSPVSRSTHINSGTSSSSGLQQSVPSSPVPFRSNNPFLSTGDAIPASSSAAGVPAPEDYNSPISIEEFWYDSDNDEDEDDDEWDTGDSIQDEDDSIERNVNDRNDSQPNYGNDSGLFVVSENIKSPEENLNSSNGISINSQRYPATAELEGERSITLSPYISESAGKSTDSPRSWPFSGTFNLEAGSGSENTRQSVQGRYKDLGNYHSTRLDRWNSPSTITRDCNICGEAQAGQQFLPATLDCDHDIDYCRECLQNWIESQMDTKGWDKITCPETQCRKTLDANDIQRSVAKETYQRYALLSTKAVLGTVENFRWCLRSGCTNGQIHESGIDGPIFRCAACGFRVCVIHNTPWHEGETCGEFDYRTDKSLKHKEEEASKVTIQKTTQKCPRRGCGTNIEKIDGCDHMTCKKCGHEFCWICLCDYEPVRRRGNSSHQRTCSHYRS